LARENPDVDLSATIWLADWEERLLWAQAPAGYDYEYRREPLEGPSVTWLGAESTRGHVERTTPDDPLFKDKVKARKMRMERILSTPIFDDAAATRSIGTLNVCQFRTADPTAASNRDALPTDTTVIEFANLVGEATTAFERVREEAACAHLDWKMEVSRFATDASQIPAAQFHVLKEVLRECFAADGCSIFLPDENNEFLDLVSSTGIRGEALVQHEGRWVVRRTEPTRYPLRDADNRSVMQFLFDTPGMALVLNRVSDITRHQWMLAHGLPQEIYRVGMEHITPDVEERRFLGIGIRGEERTWVVVRLVRSTENPPFTVADGRLLEALAGLCNRSGYWSGRGSNPFMERLCGDAGAHDEGGLPDNATALMGVGKPDVLEC
jgi:GAF domain-containing protein